MSRRRDQRQAETAGDGMETRTTVTTTANAPSDAVRAALVRMWVDILVESIHARRATEQAAARGQSGQQQGDQESYGEIQSSTAVERPSTRRGVRRP